MKKTIISLAPKTVLGYKKNGQPIYNIAGGSDPVDGGGYTGEDNGLTEPQGTGGGSTGINPSWQEYLNEVPQEFHEKIIPAFQKWDTGVQKRFDQVHQTYEPWKPIVDAGIDAETAQFALQLLNSINEDPKTVWEAIGNYHNFMGSAGGQGQVEPQQTEEDPYSGRFSELERQNQIMAAHLLKTQQREAEAQAEAQLDQELNQMRDKYKAQGAFDERFVLALMSSGMETEQAVQEFYSHRDNLLQQYGQKPLIMGTGGGVPQFNNTDVRKLSNGQTKDLVTQMLQQAAAERNR
jgi:hypothetical protein